MVSAVCHLNRAACHIRLQDWQQAEVDCASAIQLEPANTQVSGTPCILSICAMEVFPICQSLAVKLCAATRQLRHCVQAEEAAYQDSNTVRAEIWWLQAESRYDLWQQETESARHAHHTQKEVVLPSMRRAHKDAQVCLSAACHHLCCCLMRSCVGPSLLRHLSVCLSSTSHQ